MEDEDENERLKKVLINSYKIAERRYLENLKEIEEIDKRLGSLD